LEVHDLRLSTRGGGDVQNHENSELVTRATCCDAAYLGNRSAAASEHAKIEWFMGGKEDLLCSRSEKRVIEGTRTESLLC